MTITFKTPSTYNQQKLVKMFTKEINIRKSMLPRAEVKIIYEFVAPDTLLTEIRNSVYIALNKANYQYNQFITTGY